MSFDSAVIEPPVRAPFIRHRVRGRVMVLLCALYAISYVDRVNIATAAPFIQDDLGLSNTQLGLALSAFSIPYALLQVFGGWLGDRLGARRTLTVLSIIWAVATIATGGAMSLAFLFMARLALGIGESAAFPTATSVMSRWLPSEHRGAGQGLTHAVSRLANALTPLIMVPLIGLVTWRGSFVVLGVVSVVWAVVWWTYFRDVPREHRAVGTQELGELQRGHSAGARATRTPWRLIAPAVLPVAIVDFCYGWLLWVYLTWLPTVFKASYGLQLKDFALYTTLILSAGVVGDLLGGYLTDRLGLRLRSLRTARRIPILVGLGGSLVALGPLVLTQALLPTTILLAVAFFFLELTNSTLWTLPMDIAPEHAGAASGFMNTGFGLAGIASPLVFGVLLDASGGDWHQPMIVAAALLMVGMLVCLAIDPAQRTTPAAV